MTTAAPSVEANAVPSSPSSSFPLRPAEAKAAAAATTGPYSSPLQGYLERQHEEEAAEATARGLVLGNEPLLRHVLTVFLSLQDQLLHAWSVSR